MSARAAIVRAECVGGSEEDAEEEDALASHVAAGCHSSSSSTSSAPCSALTWRASGDWNGSRSGAAGEEDEEATQPESE